MDDPDWVHLDRVVPGRTDGRTFPIAVDVRRVCAVYAAPTGDVSVLLESGDHIPVDGSYIDVCDALGVPRDPRDD